MTEPTPDPGHETLEVLQELHLEEEEPETPPPTPAAPAISDLKYCLVCHQQIRASARVCPECGSRVVLYEGSGDREVYRFFLGSFLVTFGSLLPWGIRRGDFGFTHPLGVVWILAGLWGMWRMWIALLARRVSVPVLFLQILPFFWGLKFGVFRLLAYQVGPEGILADLLQTNRFQTHLMEVGIGRLVVFTGSLITLATFAFSLRRGVKEEKAKKAAAIGARQAARAAKGAEAAKPGEPAKSPGA